jgi:hypothetical protein
MPTTTKANSKPRRQRQNAEDASGSPITRKGDKRVPENKSSATSDSRAFNDGSTQLNKNCDPPSGRSQRGGAVLDVPVNFGDVSIGDGTARIGVRIDRSLLNIDAADELLCGRRLNGRLLVTPPGDANSQTYIDPEVSGDLKHELESTFDVKRFSASPKNITAGLTFSLQEVEVSELSHFAKRGGRLVVASIAEIPAKQRGRKKAKAKAK